MVLQSPVLPVMEGHDVTLTCEKRKSPNLPADFYKNDSFFGRGPKGYVTIRRFSKSDEGFYRCNIGAEESPPSWMLMKGNICSLSGLQHCQCPRSSTLNSLTLCPQMVPSRPRSHCPLTTLTIMSMTICL